MKLLELHSDKPLSWETLLRWNAEWHATHDRYGNILPVAASPSMISCYVCQHGWHERCGGRAGTWVDRTDCECAKRRHT